MKRIVIATVQVPFVQGGAEYLADGLRDALREAGHVAEIVTVPFWFAAGRVSDAVRTWQGLDFTRFDGGAVDGVIALKFPAYHVRHPNKTTWLLHQHRAVYDLWNTEWGDSDADPAAVRLREALIASDRQALGEIAARYAISRTVCDRLERFNGLAATPLYHPPPGHAAYAPDGPIFPYVFAPSRLEHVKRQDLLIRAMVHVDRPLAAVIGGTGGMAARYRELAQALGVEDRVRFVGHVSEAQKRRYYGNALAVFFAPYEEDLGYVTLEAMLSGRPVVTCRDSGGPTEFVVDDETGFVADPDPEAIAERINALWRDRGRARDMGRAGWERYGSLDISWHNVVSTLTGALS